MRCRLYCRFTAASLLLPCCVTAASLMLYLRCTGSAGGAYGQSKLAQIMHMRELQRRVPGASRVKCFAAALLLRHCCVTAASLLLYCCVTDTLLEVHRRCGGGASRVKCFAVTPGFVLTNIFRPPALLYPLFWFISRSPHVGAQVISTMLYCCFTAASLLLYYMYMRLLRIPL